jgi:hypothetical protein
MIKLLFFTSLVFILCCSQKTKTKGIDNIILKQSDSLHLELYVDYKSAKEVILEGKFKNISKSDFQFYKYLLPNENECQDIFQIVTMKDLEPLNYIGQNLFLKNHNKINEYCYEPILEKGNFYTIASKGSISFKLNLANFYDFSKINSNEELGILYQVDIPFIVNGKHFFEIDSVDKKLKPVYFWIRYLNGLNLTRVTFSKKVL